MGTLQPHFEQRRCAWTLRNERALRKHKYPDGRFAHFSQVMARNSIQWLAVTGITVRNNEPSRGQLPARYHSKFT